MSAPLRPLRPATAGVARGPPEELTGGQRKREKVSIACEACRLSKTKVSMLLTSKTHIETLTMTQCSSERPTCRAYTRRKTECRYIETESRKARQKYEDLRKHQSVHEELLSLMKTLPEQDAVELFHRIRAGGDVGAILNHVKDGNLLLQLQLAPETRFRYELPYRPSMPASLLTSGSPYLESLLYEAASLHISPLQPHESVTKVRRKHNCSAEPRTPEYQHQYVKPYHAAVFVEPRLEKVRPSEWTSVSSDDALMRELLAGYFTHEYHLYPVFQKDYFLEDMACAERANQRTECCSALLVNATLAYASVSSAS